MNRRRFRPALLALCLTLPLAGAAGSQEASPAEPAEQEQVKEEPGPEEVLAMMGPMLGGMMEGMMEATLTVMARQETATRLATFTRNFYEALLAKGFTKEEALGVVRAVGFPALSSGK